MHGTSSTTATLTMSPGLAVSTRKMPVSRKMSLSKRLPAISMPQGFPDLSVLVNGIASTFSPVVSNPAPVNFDLPNGEVTCWLIDTRNLWNGSDIWSAPGAAEAMALISLPEQKTVSTKMFISDAKMSLASALLKRLFITKTLNIPWKDVRLGRKGDKKHGKPCAVDNLGRPVDGIDFNISHQAGLVALIGWNGKKQHKYAPNGGIEGVVSPRADADTDVMVGADIVCVGERDDIRIIESEGVDSWIDIYDFVFSDEERWSMKYDVDYVTLLDGTILTREDLGRHDRCITRNQPITIMTNDGNTVSFNSDLLVDAKIRRFYTYFCYKEAYIKLSGEALLAPWLKSLEFFNVRSPLPGVAARCSTHGQWGEEVDDVEVHMHGQEVQDVKVKVQSYEESYMISTAIQGQITNLKVPAFQKLDVRTDVIAWAHKHLTTAPLEHR